MPKILQAQQQYGPGFSQLNLEQLQQYGPQYAQAALDLQKAYAPQFADIERQLSPELAASQDVLTAELTSSGEYQVPQDILQAQTTLRNFLNQTGVQESSLIGAGENRLAEYLQTPIDAQYQALRPGILEDIRAGQSLRGLGAISPLGSIDESVQLARFKQDLLGQQLGVAAQAIPLGGQLTELRQRQAQQPFNTALQVIPASVQIEQLKQSLKDRRLNVALSTANRVPISTFPQIQGTSGTGQLVQNVNPDSIFGYQQGLNNFNASIFGTQANIYGNQLANPTPNIFGTIAGSVAGSALGSFTGGAGYTAGANLGRTIFA